MCEWERGLADRILEENELETILFWSECSEMLINALFQHEKLRFHCAYLLVMWTRLHTACCLMLSWLLKEAGDDKATICCILLSHLLPAHFCNLLCWPLLPLLCTLSWSSCMCWYTCHYSTYCIRCLLPKTPDCLLPVVMFWNMALRVQELGLCCGWQIMS